MIAMQGLRWWAVAFTFLFLVTTARAGGPFDGTWSGSATKSAGSNCHIANALVAIADGNVSGTLQRHTGPIAIGGIVGADGSLNGKIGDAPFAGKFSGNSFEGTYHSTECGDRTVMLKPGS
jgi:hypothetical protein